MLTLTQQFSPVAAVAEVDTRSVRPVGRGVVGWLVQAIVAIHLIPALVVVLMVGGAGMLLMGGVRLVNSLQRSTAA